MEYNQLKRLPDGLFDKLTQLETLYLRDNQLWSVPVETNKHIINEYPGRMRKYFVSVQSTSNSSSLIESQKEPLLCRPLCLPRHLDSGWNPNPVHVPPDDSNFTLYFFRFLLDLPFHYLQHVTQPLHHKHFCTLRLDELNISNLITIGQFFVALKTWKVAFIFYQKFHKKLR